MQGSGYFLLGVGAQKTGTTWLHGYLSRFAEVDFGPLKEYHVWDAILTDIFPKMEVTEQALVAAQGSGRMKATRLRYAMQTVPGFYEFHFRSLIEAGARLTGDITPSYSSLPADAYALIRRRMEKAGLGVKVVFIMRDPFERIWSEVRMYQRNRERRGIVKQGVDRNEDQLRIMFKARSTIARTDYRRTIENLEKAFDASQILYLVYEDLFTRPSLERIAEFFGVGVDESFLGERLNVSAKQQDIDPQLRAEVMGHYAHVYEFCAGRFPVTRELWGQAA